MVVQALRQDNVKVVAIHPGTGSHPLYELIQIDHIQCKSCSSVAATASNNELVKHCFISC